MTDQPAVKQFRDAAYADQPMTWISSMALGSGAEAQQSPWPLFRKAAEHVRAHDRNLAVQELQALLARPELGTRARLLAWNALRELGQPPDASLKDQVQGIVIEIPDADGPDVLAVYADGSARYISPDGRTIAWDGKPGVPSDRVAQMIAEAQKIVNSVKPIDQRPVVKTKVRITLLTFGGMRSAEEDATVLRSGRSPLSPVFTTAAATIVALARATSDGAGGE